MGLFGALFAGVAGLGSQSNKIGIVSNNISNVNTVGYKEANAAFSTLVVPGASSGTFSPGGVLGNNRQLVSQQGLIQATTSVTDIAISGGGLFVVNTKPDGSGDTLYTRAGSFTPDSSGNFKNSAGFYLQGLQVKTPALSVNPGNLTTVNVNQNATGASVATSLISIAANFNATQAPLVGSGEVTSLTNDATNINNNAKQILIPTTGATGNGLVRGDSFSINVNGSALSDTFVYGGFKIGRNITTGTVGDGGFVQSTLTNVGPMTTTADQTHLTITIPSTEAANYVVGNSVYVAGLSGTANGIASTDVNGQNLTITGTSTSGSNTTLTLALPSGVTATSTTPATVGGTAITITNRTFAFPTTGHILDAAGDSDDFLAKSSPSTFANNALSFTATVGGTSYTFKYTSTPNTSTGQFNSLATLVTAINNSSDGKLTASLVNHQLYISATDSNQGVTFANGNASGTAEGSGHLPGIDWVKELDLQDITDESTSGVHRFNSIQSLADQINAANPTNLIATVTGNSVSINAIDPQSTISFTDDTTNTGKSILQALGFVNSSNSSFTIDDALTMANVGATGYKTGTFTARYASADTTKNMSSGAVTPQFTKDITVYDSLGISHTISMNVAKLSSLKWAVEFTAVPADDVISTTGDGQVGAGIVTFNGDGTLLNVVGLNNGLTINWNPRNITTGGANQSNITLNLGTANKTDGLTQFSGSSNVSQAIQNGSPTGQLTGVSIDEDGFVTASFSNGQTQKLYQIPLASVNNYNGMESVSGNAYKQTLSSGEVSLSLAGTNGTGTLAASALEQSNVDLSTQLTDLIVAQQAYGANTRVLTVTSQLLQQLNQIVQ